MAFPGKKTGRTSVVILTLASAFAGSILGAKSTEIAALSSRRSD